LHHKTYEEHKEPFSEFLCVLGLDFIHIQAA
jgi:hypothetical protein